MSAWSCYPTTDLRDWTFPRCLQTVQTVEPLCAMPHVVLSCLWAACAEGFLAQCVQDVRQEIGRRRQGELSSRHGRPASAASAGPGYSEFDESDRSKVMEMLLSQERVTCSPRHSSLCVLAARRERSYIRCTSHTHSRREHETHRVVRLLCCR